MATIPLTRGQVALVDAADYEWLNQWTWYASWNQRIRAYYAVRRCPFVYMHRLILGLGSGDKRRGDHTDPSATLDNRRSNLRIATVSQNAFNARISRRNTSGYKGVSFAKRVGLWRAFITINGKRKQVGQFNTPELAYEAYCRAATQHYGEFARFAVIPSPEKEAA